MVFRGKEIEGSWRRDRFCSGNEMNLKVGIRKLLIDRANPTNYDRDRLEAIAL